ncbi:MAG TPA: hypothetical protein VH591_08840 [Ktedonobacterales bacterium]|jgi:hypothetical protein
MCPIQGLRDRPIVLAVPRAVLGFADEMRWGRFAHLHLRTWADASDGGQARCARLVSAITKQFLEWCGDHLQVTSMPRFHLIPLPKRGA